MKNSTSCANVHVEVTLRNVSCKENVKVIAVLESGTIRNYLHLPYIDFDEVLPWPNELILLQVKGNILRNMLQHRLSSRSKNGGGFLQVSGLQYSYTKTHVQKNVHIIDKMNKHNVLEHISLYKLLDDRAKY